MATKTSFSIAEFERLPDDGMRHELDEGELITMPPAGFEHGDTSVSIITVLATFVKQHGLGKVLSTDTGFVLGEETVRAPDAAFVRKERLVRTKGFFRGAPDLAVEVFSPSDSVPQLMRKVRQYLDAGTHTVWVFYPETRQVHMFESGKKDRILERDDTLEAPELLPGFSVKVDSLFE